MLTKEEFNKLIIELDKVDIHSSDLEGAFYNDGHVYRTIREKWNQKIVDCIIQFVEKPIREIQIGDFYRNGEGDFLRITGVGINVDIDSGKKMSDSLQAIRLKDSVAFSFECNINAEIFFRIYIGRNKCFSIAYSWTDKENLRLMALNLSRRYVLTEIDNVN